MRKSFARKAVSAVTAFWGFCNHSHHQRHSRTGGRGAPGGAGSVKPLSAQPDDRFTPTLPGGNRDVNPGPFLSCVKLSRSVDSISLNRRAEENLRDDILSSGEARQLRSNLSTIRPLNVFERPSPGLRFAWTPFRNFLPREIPDLLLIRKTGSDAMPHINFETTNTSQLRAVRDWEDEAVWHSFQERYGPLLLCCCNRLGLKSSDIDEACQETWIEVAKRMRSFVYQLRP
jgi:hypothetical protein